MAGSPATRSVQHGPGRVAVGSHHHRYLCSGPDVVKDLVEHVHDGEASACAAADGAEFVLGRGERHNLLAETPRLDRVRPRSGSHRGTLTCTSARLHVSTAVPVGPDGQFYLFVLVHVERADVKRAAKGPNQSSQPCRAQPRRRMHI